MQRRDLKRLEDLAQRARKAESAGFQLSHPGSPSPPSAHSASMRSYRASQLPHPPNSAGRKSQRSPLPPAPVNAEYYDENGTSIRVYGGNGTINLDPGQRDPFADAHSFTTNGSSTHSSNIIPIQYIPPGSSEHGPTDAAKKLDEARQNLFRPKPAPVRPARSPDLDLRDPNARDARSPNGGLPPRIRDSYLSDNSAAPSFLSGNSYDVHNDAPKIVTSKQVHVGRLQQAEVVQFGKANPYSPYPFTPSSELTPPEHEAGLASPATFGTRSLTPASASARGFDFGAEEGLAMEPPTASSGDLRFSMGSLAYRDSMSSTGTGQYLARPDSAAVPPPRGFAGPRESMVSAKSYADSFLSGFPMIPPGQGGVPAMPASNLPQSSSIATLDHAAVGPPPAVVSGSSRPPPSFRSPRGAAGAQSRPVTATSIADSFLGSFPFVPPNQNDLAELPSAALPSAAVPDAAKRQNLHGMGGVPDRGVSTTSEGLGGFDFVVEPGKK